MALSIREASPAVEAFDAIAGVFDERFGGWASVAAQRRAVRRYLLAAFPPGASLLELGGGTGEDAIFLAERGRRVTLTDGAPRMVERAREKAERAGLGDRVRALEARLEWLEEFARDWLEGGGDPFDGAYSNFAALNCVEDLGPVARGLARLLRPGAPALLVMFGPFSPGEVLVQLARGDPRAAIRRLSRGAVPARLGGRHFSVRYPGPGEVARAFAPYFRLVRKRGIGIFVPPSAAEPEISAWPRLLGWLERLDRVFAAPLALLGDHVLLHFVRTDVPAPETGAGGAGRRAWTAARGEGMTAPEDLRERLRRFRAAYAAHRAAEGRGRGGEEELLALPYLRRGPTAKQWAVRARSFDRFLEAVLEARVMEAVGRSLRVLDLGAGNGWLAYRVQRLGHRATAVDIRDDDVDGLGAARAYRRHLPVMFDRVVASFEALPFAARTFDIAVFNASIHYALDLAAALAEAARVVVPGGRIAILDSPFYASDEQGEAMVAEKRREAERRFGARAGDLMALPFVEYLTPDRLAEASARLGLEWRRHRVRYPLWYEARPLLAALGRRRPPSRFDVWEAKVP